MSARWMAGVGALALFLAADPAIAQLQPVRPVPAPAPAPAGMTEFRPDLTRPSPAPKSMPMEEIIVEGVRPVLPTFQDEWEFQQMEFERLRKRFEPPPIRVDRIERMTGSPNIDKGKGVMRSPSSAVSPGELTPK